METCFTKLVEICFAKLLEIFFARTLQMKQMLVPSLAFFGLTFGLLLGHARAQDSSKPPRPVESQTAKPANAADVSSVDAIIAALYDTISGPAGKPRDWAD